MEKSGTDQQGGDLTKVQIKDIAELYYYPSGQPDLHLLDGQPMDIALLCVKEGHVDVESSFTNQNISLAAGEGIWLANPKGPWNTKCHVHAQSAFFILRMHAKVFHQLLNPHFNADQLESTPKVNMRDLSKRIAVSPPMLVCFDQLFYQRLRKPFQGIFEQAKFMEIFSLLMEATMGQDTESCPVMLTQAIENKLHLVRRHIIQHMDEVPDPDQLAIMYELPRNTLREGYRHVFGKTIHQYHADHKLEYAMQMLSGGEFLVKEIAFRIGYQNPSHFITAFKKKYGFTPKQYLKREAISA